MKCGSRDLSRWWLWRVATSSSTTNSSDEDSHGILEENGERLDSSRCFRSRPSLSVVDRPRRRTKCQVLNPRFVRTATSHGMSVATAAKLRPTECGSTLLYFALCHLLGHIIICKLNECPTLFSFFFYWDLCVFSSEIFIKLLILKLDHFFENWIFDNDRKNEKKKKDLTDTTHIDMVD